MTFCSFEPVNGFPSLSVMFCPSGVYRSKERFFPFTNRRSHLNEIIDETLYLIGNASPKQRFTGNDVRSTFAFVDQRRIIFDIRLIDIVGAHSMIGITFKLVISGGVGTLFDADLRGGTNEGSTFQSVGGKIDRLNAFCPIEEIQMWTIGEFARSTKISFAIRWMNQLTRITCQHKHNHLSYLRRRIFQPS